MRYLTIIFALLPGLLVAQSLDTYVEEALRAHPGIRAEEGRSLAIRSQMDRESGLSDPTLTASYAITPIETRVGPQIARFSLMQPLPWFGTLGAREKAAYWRWQASEEELIQKKALVTREVRVTYHQLQEWKAMDRLLEENVRVLEDLENIATTRFESGNESMLDVLRIQMEKEEAMTRWENWKATGRSLRSNFNLLLQRPEGTEIVIDTLVPPTSILPSVDSLSTENHPSVTRWNLESMAANEQMRVARKEGAPKFAIGVDYMMIGQRTGVELPDNGKDAIMPMVSLSLPLWRKRYNGQEMQANMMTESYNFRREDAIRELQGQREDVIADLSNSRRDLVKYRSLIEKANVALKLGMNAYSTGDLAFEELMRLEQQWIRYREEWVRSVGRLLIANAKLEYLNTKSQ